MNKKVHFYPWVRVRPITNEDRQGTWAVDGTRFRARIKYVGTVLEPVLSETHRDTIPPLYD